MNKEMLQNRTMDSAIKVMCVANEYSWLKANGLTLVKQQSLEKDGKHYDELICTDGSVETSLFFDISGFYRKEPGLVFKGKDLPVPDTEYNAVDFFELDKIMSISTLPNNVLNTKLVFQRWSSEQLSKYIFLPYNLETNSILGSPVRDYYNETIPILHGFHFMRLMFIHKLAHMLDGYDERNSAIEPKSKHIPIMGEECCEFNTLEPYNYLNDLLNFTFLTHKPDAFYHVQETQALLNSLQYGLAAKMFTKDEVKTALKLVGLTEDFMETITNNI